jgi:hypothetical protein
VLPGGPGPRLRRRTLLAGTAAAALVMGRRLPAAAGAPVEAVDLGGVEVLPRAAWAGALTPAGPILPEPDVRYLLVHHSVDPGNDYASDDVAGVLRGFFRFHTSADKGWPDLAYNFLVDRFGRGWEGRAGSLAGPVAGDATGGNQGFDQLCCFVGNHQQEEPSPEAFSAMGRLLGALASRYGIPLGPDATAGFTSRGSNRHPPGTTVTTPTIAGHRDMSLTQCPGDRVAARLPELRLLAAASAAPAPPPTAVPGPAEPATTAAPVETTAPPTTPTTTTTTAPSSGPPLAATGDGGDAGPAAFLAGGAAATVAAATGAALLRQRRRRADSDPG